MRISPAAKMPSAEVTQSSPASMQPFSPSFTISFISLVEGAMPTAAKTPLHSVLRRSPFCSMIMPVTLLSPHISRHTALRIISILSVCSHLLSLSALPLKLSLRWIRYTFRHMAERYNASLRAVSPPPITAISFSLKNPPSHTAQ